MPTLTFQQQEKRFELSKLAAALKNASEEIGRPIGADQARLLAFEAVAFIDAFNEANAKGILLGAVAPLTLGNYGSRALKLSLASTEA